MRYHKLHSVWVIRGQIRLSSGLLIGGERDGLVTDIQMIKDEQGEIFIPGTSIAGSLRNSMYQLANSNQIEYTQLDEFWGDINNNIIDTDDESATQSIIIIPDATVKGAPNLEIRERVKINRKTGVVADKNAKFNHELVEKDTEFDLNIEIHLTNRNEINEKIIYLLLKILKKGFQIGFGENIGLGRCKYVNREIYHFDFSNPSHSLAWLTKEFDDSTQVSNLDLDQISLNYKSFKINASFTLKDNINIREYYPNPDNLANTPDSRSLISGGDSIISGSSIRGVVVHHAIRILRSLEIDDLKIYRDLFGFNPNTSNQSSNNYSKSLLSINEGVIDDSTVNQEFTQIRNKIDRFTNATVDGALFNEMIVQQVNKEPAVELQFVLNYRKDLNYWDQYVGILLLVFKDLFEGRLSIGGESSVGRGFIEGHTSKIILYDGKKRTLKLSKISEGLSIKDENDLIPILEGFIQKIREEHK